MMTTKKSWHDSLKYRPVMGQNVINASSATSLFGFEGDVEDRKMNEFLSRIVGSREDRVQLGSAIYAPILQQVPYIELYSRFFQQISQDEKEDTLFALDIDGTDANLPSIVWSSHPNGDIFFNEPGFKFARPSWQTFTHGIRVHWDVQAYAGWNVLERAMSYCAWELARQRDTAALSVITAAIPTSHQANFTGSLAKAPVDNIIRASNQIGFPVKFAVINPGRLMEMQNWTWVMPSISDAVADSLVNNLFYGQYGGVNWYASPNAPANKVYFGGLPEQTGWHVLKGSGRSDSDVDITAGVDLYTVRDPLHAWYVGNSGLNLWSLTII